MSETQTTELPPLTEAMTAHETSILDDIAELGRLIVEGERLRIEHERSQRAVAEFWRKVDQQWAARRLAQVQP